MSAMLESNQGRVFAGLVSSLSFTRFHVSCFCPQAPLQMRGKESDLTAGNSCFVNNRLTASKVECFVLFCF